MAVGTGRSANQLHIYSEEGVASRPWGGGGAGLRVSLDAGALLEHKAGPLHSERSPWAACSLPAAPRAPSCWGAQKAAGGRGVASKWASCGCSGPSLLVQLCCSNRGHSGSRKGEVSGQESWVWESGPVIEGRGQSSPRHQTAYPNNGQQGGQLSRQPSDHGPHHPSSILHVLGATLAECTERPCTGGFLLECS